MAVARVLPLAIASWQSSILPVMPMTARARAVFPASSEEVPGAPGPRPRSAVMHLSAWPTPLAARLQDPAGSCHLFSWIKYAGLAVPRRLYVAVPCWDQDTWVPALPG